MAVVPASDLRFRTRVAGALLGLFLRILTKTLRVRIQDDSALLSRPDTGIIWLFWHNRLFIVPALYIRYTKKRRPGVVLTSASRDGALLSAVMRHFGLSSVRGSSSRRGAQALLEARRRLRDACCYLAITPDGPRGPAYRMQPGAVFLARSAGVPVLPVRVEYESSWRLRSWDRFHIPKPFSRVRVHFLPLYTPDSADPEEDRARLEAMLRPETG